jgi:hypothetical protein
MIARARFHRSRDAQRLLNPAESRRRSSNPLLLSFFPENCPNECGSARRQVRYPCGFGGSPGFAASPDWTIGVGPHF